jgi:phosphatidate cytidylyltransferase
VALDKKTFYTRTLTAVIFAAIMLAGIFTSAWLFIILFLLILLGGTYEFVKLVKKISPHKYWQFLPLAFFYIVLPVLMMMDLGMQLQLFEKRFSREALQLYSPLFPAAIIFSIWVNDTMAYIVGSLIGKTPFSKISPKKTWEGSAGGVLLCVITITLLGAFIPAAQGIAVVHWMAIALICAVFGTMGDLLESKIKRLAGVKDSGSFMPGHGGFLDRFDSLLIATPVVWFYIRSVVAVV